VDAVYIPLPTGVRKEWVLKAAAAGKHVLVEKPVACTLEDAREMVAACAVNGVLLMDGVMFMHHDRLATVRSLLDSRVLGERTPSKMVASFSITGDDAFFSENIRVDTKMEPLGALGDLGW
jgi:predicted dehydrogenase